MLDTPRLFPPTREEALARLDAFLPKAGRDYAAQRNYDRPGHPDVSRLSPYLRHRLISEEETLAAVLQRHSRSAAEKFIQEVLWRSYWKGWLELRPAVWEMYREGVHAACNRLQTEDGLRLEWEAACKGETGIDAFDHWARELVETGYLHNHARMWFASIWIFTLRLPWELGADFFLRHLIDGDPASNTLSWRWVGGLQTRGKTYLARASNIARYTEGRFEPRGLAKVAPPLDGGEVPPPRPLPASDPVEAGRRTGLLLHEDDLTPGWLLDTGIAPVSTLALSATKHRSPFAPSENVVAFTDGAITDTILRLEERLGAFAYNVDPVAWVTENELEQVVTPYAPAGPMGDRIDALQAAGVPIRRVMRPFDARAWPHATHGFFRFKDQIPAILDRLET